MNNRRKILVLGLNAAIGLLVLAVLCAVASWTG